jgi:hypothetical protein
MGARVLHDPEVAWYQEYIPKARVAFDELAGGRGFSTRERFKQTKEQILAETEAAARDVGDDGTLVWYVASHGQDGMLRTFDAQTIKPKELVDALRRGRTKGGKVRRLKRLYMFFDYCQAAVTLKGVAEAVGAPTVQDLSASTDALLPQDDVISALADVGPAPGPQMALAGDDEPLYESALFYSVTADNQYTFGSTFLGAFATSLALFHGHRAVSIRQFFDQVNLQITKTEQETMTPGGTVTRPQRAVYLALPDQGFMNDTLFAAVAKNWPAQGEPCPPWRGIQWNFVRGRSVNGKCPDPDALCTCMSVQTPAGPTCRIAGPARFGARVLGEAAQFDAGTKETCYDSCTATAKRFAAAVQNACGGVLMVKNPIDRLEMWNYSAALP